MKKILLFFLIIFICFSCETTFTQDEENGGINGTSTIKLSFTEIKANQMGAERKLLLGASDSWNSGITYNEEYLDEYGNYEYWIEMSSTFGDATENHEIIITVKPREDVITRSASIVIKCNETSNYETITVTQSNEKFRAVELDGTESLESKLGDGYSTSRIKTLVITGVGLTPEDFYYLRDELTSLKNLDISKTETTTVPNSAFGDGTLEKSHYNISHVKLPESVTKIEDCAFTGCTLLTSINIPNSVTSIGDIAFAFCSSLTAINIPDGITIIHPYTFDGCSSLTSITLPNSVKEIGDFAFNKCTLLASINIPDGVKSIGTDVFAFCSSLASINIPDGVKSIGNNVFAFCSSLTSITLPNSIESIGDNAFNSCSLTSIVIPNSVTKLGENAFSVCEKLTSINIPDGIKEIPNFLFSYCKALTTITLPSSVTSIGAYAFISCDKLASINIPYGVTTIGRGAFMSCRLLPSIIIPNSVTEIGIEAFAFSWLESVTLSEKLEKIEYGTFYRTSVKSIIIPNSVTEIVSRAFSEATTLESAIISDNVTTIGDDAFYKTSLKSITIPAKVKSIGKRAFSGYNFLWAREITSLAPVPPVLGVDCINEFNLEHIYVPESSVQAYKDANEWKKYSDKIKAIPQSSND